jgi:hypothetical protein
MRRNCSSRDPAREENVADVFLKSVQPIACSADASRNYKRRAPGKVRGVYFGKRQ